MPESIDNGDVSYPSTTLSSVAVYDCDAGYTLVGTNNSVVCNENGQWAGPTPTCTSKINQTDTSEKYLIRVKNSGWLTHISAHACNNISLLLIADCGLLDPPNNTTFVTYPDNSTLVNSTAQYSCRNGYILPTNATTRVCNKNGNWTLEEPVCQREYTCYVSYTCLSLPTQPLKLHVCLFVIDFPLD